MLNIGKKLRTARKKQGLSLRELATMANVSASLLSQIENGHANPSVGSLFSIATALSVPIHYFFPYLDDDTPESSDQEAVGIRPTAEMNGNEVPVAVAMTSSQLRAAQESVGTKRLPETEIQNDQVPVLRADERPFIELMDSVTWTRLTPRQEESLEFLEVCYEVGGSSGPARSRHSGREFGLVLEGNLHLELGFEEYILGEGDSIIFNSAVPHRLSNAGDSPMRAVWVNIDHR